MFHIVKDKDGNEQVMTDEEYSRHKSLNAFGGFVEAATVSAYQHGGVLHALNILLLVGLTLLLMIGSVAYDIFPPDTSALGKVGQVAGGILIVVGLIMRARWIALLVQLATIAWLLSQMLHIR